MPCKDHGIKQYTIYNLGWLQNTIAATNVIVKGFYELYKCFSKVNVAGKHR